MNFRTFSVLVLVCVLGFVSFQLICVKYKDGIKQFFSAKKNNSSPAPIFNQPMLEDLLTQSNLSILQNPEKVEAFLLQYKDELSSIENSSDPAKFSVAVGPNEVWGPDLEQWRTYLVSPQNYVLGHSQCPFFPEAVLDFIQGSERVNVWMSFTCQEIRFYRNMEMITYINTTSDMYNMLSVLLYVFPEDKLLNELNNRHSTEVSQ